MKQSLDPSARDLIELIQRTETITARIHGIMDSDRIFSIVEEELRKLKHNFSILFQLDTDNNSWSIKLLTLPKPVIAAVEKLVGKTIDSMTIPAEKNGVLSRARESGETHVFPSIELAAELLPSSFAHMAARLTGHDKKNTIASPLYLRNEVIGVLMMDTPLLADHFILSVKNLTQHISTALELADENKKRMLAEKELVAAQHQADAANRAKSEFLASMSHEIRVPMNTMVGFADLLKNSPLAPQQRDYVESIVAAGEVLVSLVNNILDLSKIESGKMALEQVDFDLEAIIRSVLKMMSMPPDREPPALKLVYPAGAPRHFMGDPTRITQIFMNLVGNAVKFTEKGEVSIVVGVGPTTASATSVLSISVTDTGIGIPKEKQHLLFTPFFQAESSTARRYGGSGLGLAITRFLIEMMGGAIDLRSNPGKGTTISFTLALKPGAPTVESLNGHVAPDADRDLISCNDTGVSSLRKPDILVVEDNPLNRKLMSILLKQMNCTIDTANDGNEAICKVLKKTYDLILMDIQMPFLDGIEATKQIRNRLHLDIPIIALTANAFQEDRKKCLAAGMNGYLMKPVDLTLLGEMIRKWGYNRQDQPTADITEIPAPDRKA